MNQTPTPATVEQLAQLNAYWQPVRPTILKDEALTDKLHREGYAVVPFLSEEQLTALRDIYNRDHDITQGGMFYSIYSQDLAYRQRVHEEVGAVFAPSVEKYFKDYKTVLNTFITKSSGEDSEFYLHQDTTGLDEFKHTALSVWAPLVDVTPENGAMYMMKYSHWLFSPYRSISFGQPFDNIAHSVRRYLEPVSIKAGEAIIFDFRVVHNSPPNLSGKPRVVALTGLIPKDATFLTCFREPAPGARTELFEHEDDYLLKYPNFLQNCHIRPTSGTQVGYAKFEMPDMSETEFLAKTAAIGLQPLDLAPTPSALQTRMIPEPVFHEGMPEANCGCEMPEKQAPAAEPAKAGLFDSIRKLLKV